MIPTKPLCVLDIEVAPNYVLFSFMDRVTRVSSDIEMVGSQRTMTDEQVELVDTIMRYYTTFGFNSLNYDIPLIMYAMQYIKVEDIYYASQTIVEGKVWKPWEVWRNLGIYENPDYDHIDIIRPAPAINTGLKLYGTRLHSHTIRDLPYAYDENLTEAKMTETVEYCHNDLRLTCELYDAIEDRIDLRIRMGQRFDVDFRSKSDAQIAEAILRSELTKKGIVVPYSSGVPKPYEVGYNPPSFIKFSSPILIELENLMSNYTYSIEKGSAKLPDEIGKYDLTIGNKKYKVGIGGLHSVDKCECYEADDEYELIDKDVASYYPATIINNRIFPAHLGDDFLEVFKSIVDERLEAKRNKDKLVADSLKIVVNGAYGKFGSQYSFLYSPENMLFVTLTGQLSILMLIERLEMVGIQVVSANTDGFVSRVRKDMIDKYEEVCKQWEADTGYDLEATHYDKIYFRDVNNYIAFKTDGSSKGVGVLREPGLNWNPIADIVRQAVTEFLRDGTDIEDKIRGCDDVTKFCFSRTVNGGAQYNGEYLGKVVRWIHSHRDVPIFYCKNGHKVPKTSNARPMMVLTDSIPEDLNYEMYIEEARKLLKQVGCAVDNELNS